jgi:threonine dehydrogenase-like Zn-dependent dehydrogenase
MGHEAVGVIAEMGSQVTSVAEGDRVVINPTLYCGQCNPCMRGEWNFCVNKSGTEVGLDYDGSFADYMVLPCRFVHLIPDTMSSDRAVVIEPLACVLNNLEAGDVRATDNVSIIGAGPMGVLTAMLCRKAGATVALFDNDLARRELAEHILDFDNTPVQMFVESATMPSANVVFDTVGTQLETAMGIVADQGRIVVVGFNDKATANVAPLAILQRGLTIVGAGDYNGRIFPRAINLAEKLPLERLITHHFPLEDHSDAFDLLSATGTKHGYGAMKVVLTSSRETP